MTEINVLLWGVWLDNPDGAYWYGSTTKGAVMVWDQDSVGYARNLAQRLRGEVRPYLTLQQVLDEFNRARAEALKDAPAMKKALYEQIFKLGGMG